MVVDKPVDKAGYVAVGGYDALGIPMLLISYPHILGKPDIISALDIARPQQFIPQKMGDQKICLVVSTHLKNMSQIGSWPQIGMKIKNL